MRERSVVRIGLMVVLAVALSSVSFARSVSFGPFPPPPVEDGSLFFGPFPPPPVEDGSLHFGPFPPPPVEDGSIN